MDTIVLDGNNAIEASYIKSGDKVAIVELANGERVACRLPDINEGAKVTILRLKNGEKIAVRSRNCIKIGSAFSRPVSAQYEIINLGNFDFYWNGVSKVYIGAVCQDITSVNTFVDDKITITNITGDKSTSYDWGNDVTSALEITSIFNTGINTLNIQLADVYGALIRSSDLYMFSI